MAFVGKLTLWSYLKGPLATWYSPRIGDEVVDGDLGSLPVPDVLEASQHQLMVKSV